MKGDDEHDRAPAIAARLDVARNVEIKAAVADLSRVARALDALGAGPPTELVQEDTFFEGARGRLKLRRLSPTSGELIHYHRPDVAGPKTSEYTLVATTEPDRLRDALAAAYGVAGTVCKRRIVRMVGRTRLHLDEVAGLGTFVELEVVLDDGESAQDGVAEAHRLLAALGIPADALVAGAYVDLLAGAPKVGA
jgi:predicted adenylyl cyclase CyaB